MPSRTRTRLGWLAAILIVLGSLHSSTGDDKKTQALGGKTRMLAHVSTDKPIYRAGEKLYLRGVVLDAATRVPAKQIGQAVMRIKGPQGDQRASGYVKGEHGVIGASWTVPEGAPGGEYIARLEFPGTGAPPAERAFEVRAYRAPRLKHEIEFVHKGYGPGDLVQATMKVERAEGGVPIGAKVAIEARVDGRSVHTSASEVAPTGRCEVSFKLPAKIAVGEGTLAMVITDGGVVETATKTIPILLQTLDLAFYPEGGQLVAGLESRVYLQAKTPSQRPADIEGELIDLADDSVVAEVRTTHEGRGKVTFTPKAGRKYALRLSRPAGISKRFGLPEVAAKGAVISAKQRVSKDGKLALRVGSAEAGKLTVTLAKRERELARQVLELGAGEAKDLTLDAGKAEGVLVATVWSADGKPLAERLVFRAPARQLKIALEATPDRGAPGGKVQVKIKTTDGEGQPVSAVVGLTVSDDSVRKMIEPRERAPRLPVMVLLEGEVKELADAHVYLDPNNADAPEALDLLLGTQGWRRFAFVKPNSWLAQQQKVKRGDHALRVLAMHNNAWKHIARRGARGGGMPVPPGAPMEGADEMQADGADAQQGQQAENKAKRPERGPDPRANRPDNAPKKVAKLQAKEEAPAAKPAQPPMRDDARAEPRAERALRKRWAGKDALGRLRETNVGNDMVAVRVYAHQARAGRKPGDRVDFSETLFWAAGIKTGADGEASVSFALSDSVTRFAIEADGFGGDGALGSADAHVDCTEPFTIEPKLPLEVTAGDVLEIPLALVNSTDQDLEALISVSSPSSALTIEPVEPLALAPGARARRVLRVHVGAADGKLPLVIAASAGGFVDRVTRSLRVVPKGFPMSVTAGGLLQPGKPLAFELELPKDLIAGTLKSEWKVYPSPRAKLSAALARLIRDPYGCFEQTSSTTYPLVMAQQYFMSHKGTDPALIAKAEASLAKGYKRLIGFECKGGGYEWFGADPGHVALTAYGLLEFSDMAKVRQVDQAMIARTHAWLMKQRDGKGNFSRKRRTLHTWITDPDCSNSYVIWALLESAKDRAKAVKELKVELAHLEDSVAGSDNAYVWALAANVMRLAGKPAMAKELCERLAKKQGADGMVQGGTTSITGSRGQALAIETTALALLAWLPTAEHAERAARASRFLASNCQGGRYGSTQSTVLALRAIVAYDSATAKPKADGKLVLQLDGERVGEVAFKKDQTGAMQLPDISGKLTAGGTHKLTLAMEDGSEMPHALELRFFRTLPESARDCPLQVGVELSKTQLVEGNVAEAMVTISNTSDKPVPTPIAIIGLPGGCEPRHQQLKELKAAGKIAAYEVRGREVVLYWRSFEAQQELTLPLTFVAAVPGSYTGPASRAYLYYGDEAKRWVAGRSVEISAR